MPLYEYQCRKCGHRFEVIQKFSDAPVGQCPKCAGAVEKLLSVPGGLQFKGSGFYITDYVKKGEREKKKEAKTEKPAAKPDAAASSPSSDSAAKPATPAPSESKSKKSTTS
ncbi:MAG: FmdB family zinc ribbon protein [Nitrospirota bacterium]